ncbi:MAG TPA: M3 family metallopeptidase [Pseudobdellovibrionaceae bacterium]|nr:M3 family metallopeptidase [Pseudobdellovibrionaceae bacterium]
MNLISILGITILLFNTNPANATNSVCVPLIRQTERSLEYFFDKPTPRFDRFEVQDMIPAIDAHIELENQAIEVLLKNQKTPNFRNTVLVLEKMAERLNQIMVYITTYKLSLSSPEVSQTYLDVQNRLVAQSMMVFQNPALYKKFKQAYERRGVLKLREDQLRLLQVYLNNFEINGVDLSPEKKDELLQVEQNLATLSSQFGNHLLEYANSNSISLSMDPKLLKGLTPEDISKLKEYAQKRGMDGYLIPMEPNLLVKLMQRLENRELRKKVFYLWRGQGNVEGDTNNHSIISEIAKLRQKKAEILGYPTYADLILKDRMIGSRERLTKVLNKTYDQLKPYADQDFKRIQLYANEKFKLGELMPWDMPFVRTKYSIEKLKYDPQKVKKYFTLERSIEGIFKLANLLYGLNFEIQTQRPVYAKSVQIYKVTDKEGVLIGYLMMDPFSRPGVKKNGAWENSMVGGFNRTGKRVPVFVSIDLNLSVQKEGEPNLMTFGEVSTLFHEFGHALHALLSETRYFTISKNEVLWDAVELPSMLNEKFLRYPEVLSWFAYHVKTQKPFPPKYLEAILRNEKFMGAYDLMVSHLTYIAIDMAYHTGQYNEGESILDFEKRVTAPFRSPGQEHWPALTSGGFSHIFQGGYAAGYYSYFWALVLKASGFKEFVKEGQIDFSVGQRFRSSILSVGNSVDPLQAFIHFSGQEPDPQVLIDGLDLTRQD